MTRASFTFNIILDIYSENISNFDLEYTFISSGFALIKKKTSNKLNPTNKVAIKPKSIKESNVTNPTLKEKNNYVNRFNIYIQNKPI